MKIVPAITLSAGLAIYGGETRDALELTNQLLEAGATEFIVFDGDAEQDVGENLRQANQIIRTATTVTLGGGIRRMLQVQLALDAGAKSVIVGEHGVEHPEWVIETSKLFPSKLALHLHLQDGKIVGAEKLSIGQFLGTFADCELAGILISGEIPDLAGLPVETITVIGEFSAEEAKAMQNAGVAGIGVTGGDFAATVAALNG